MASGEDPKDSGVGRLGVVGSSPLLGFMDRMGGGDRGNVVQLRRPTSIGQPEHAGTVR